MFNNIVDKIQNNHWPYDYGKYCFSKFKSLDEPSTKQELWKFTNLNTWKDTPHLLSEQYELDFEQVNHLTIDEHIDLNLNEIDLGKVTINELSGTEIPTWLTKTFNEFKNSKINDQYFYLSNSLFDRIITIELNAKTRVETPLHLKQKFNGSKNTAVVLRLEDEASLPLIDELNTVEDTGLYNLFIVLGKNAQLEHTKINNHLSNSINLIYQRVSLDRDSHYKQISINVSGKVIRNNNIINLNDTGACCDYYGLSLLNGNQHCDNLLLINHFKPHTESKQLFKSILDDKSRNIFTGRVYVEKDAQLIESEQLNKNLLLSTKAQAHSQPQLEVFADDVKCAHGSTTGQINEDELFYFNTRCMDSKVARSLLTKAFCHDILFNIKFNQVRRECFALVDKKLSTLSSVEGVANE